MSAFAPADEQLKVLLRGAADVVRLGELKEKVERSRQSSKPLRVKFGMDPTAPDIHLGHTVVLRKLRQFQELGHQAVLIIGDYTALIGDPSGRSKTRPQLSEKEIEANLATYLDQVSNVLNMARLEIVRNGAWFSKMAFRDVLRLAGSFTLARMSERDDFKKRLAAGAPVGLHEVLYPLMQGWDSVVINADVELGGTDQTFNLLVGRDLQRLEGKPPQVAMTMPLLVGLDGAEKMSKSLGNYVGVTEAADEMFGKVMSLPDAAMPNYFELLTDADLGALKQRLAGGENPKNLKEELALDIVTRYHGSKAAQDAAERFQMIFSKGETPDNIPVAALERSALTDLPALLVAIGHAPSKSEARRLVEQGAVYLDGRRLSAETDLSALKNGQVLRTGKRRFTRLLFQ